MTKIKKITKITDITDKFKTLANLGRELFVTVSDANKIMKQGELPSEDRIQDVQTNYRKYIKQYKECEAMVLSDDYNTLVEDFEKRNPNDIVDKCIYINPDHGYVSYIMTDTMKSNKTFHDKRFDEFDLNLMKKFGYDLENILSEEKYAEEYPEFFEDLGNNSLVKPVDKDIADIGDLKY